MISIICNLEWCVSRIMYGNDWEWKTHTTYVLHTTIIGGNIKQILIQMMEFFLLQFNLDTKPKHQFTIEHFQNSRFFLRIQSVFSEQMTMEMEFCILVSQTWVLYGQKLNDIFTYHWTLSCVLMRESKVKTYKLLHHLGPYLLIVYEFTEMLTVSRLQISAHPDKLAVSVIVFFEKIMLLKIDWRII